jgi:hypothetical protein
MWRIGDSKYIKHCLRLVFFLMVRQKRSYQHIRMMASYSFGQFAPTSIQLCPSAR